MKKYVLLLFAFILLHSVLKAYSAQSAISYAYKYSMNNTNPLRRVTFYNVNGSPICDANTWYDYEKGSDGSGDDCANFVSQCLITGGLDSLMNYSGVVHPDGDNQYNSNIIGTVTTKSNATIIGVTDNALQDYLTNSFHAGYIYANADSSIEGGDVVVVPRVQDGVIVTLKDGTVEKHAIFLVSGNCNNGFEFDAHTTDRQNYGFHGSTGSYLYSFFHIYPTVPYVQHVTVVQGSTLIYDAHWDGGDGQAKTLTPATQAARNPGFVDTGIDTAITMTITFNESVKNVIVYFFDQNGNSLNCTAGTGNGYPSASFGNTAGLNANGTVWSGTLTTAQIATLQNPAVMHISASNFASACNQLDANPGTQAC